jgi:hypothetical protein
MVRCFCSGDCLGAYAVKLHEAKTCVWCGNRYGADGVRTVGSLHYCSGDCYSAAGDAQFNFMMRYGAR